MLPGHVVLWLVSDDHRPHACRERWRASRERHGRWGGLGGCASYDGALLSHIITQLHRHQAATTCSYLHLHLICT